MRKISLKGSYTIWEEDNYSLNKQKAKLQTGIGCFFGIIILGLLVILIPIWLLFSYDGDESLKISHSPNNVNTIEVIQKEDFPKPTIRIKYDQNSIMKTTIPDKISIQCKNDFEADVILTRQGKEPDIVKVLFE